MLNLVNKLFAPKTVIFTVGLLTVLAGVADFLLDQAFIEQYDQVAAAIVVIQNVLLGALRVARVFLPGLGLKGKK